MANDKRYVILGAGAIGCAVGGLLLDSGSRVVFVARPAQAEAIRRGIVIKQPNREVRVRGEALTDIRQAAPGPDDVILLATKSQSTLASLEELSAVYPRSVPVVSLQNGVSNEPLAAARFDNVYAGLVMLSAVQLEPELITLPMGNEVAVGLYPGGSTTWPGRWLRI